MARLVKDTLAFGGGFVFGCQTLACEGPLFLLGKEVGPVTTYLFSSFRYDLYPGSGLGKF